MPKSADIWTYLKNTSKTVVMYGMGNGADKILSVCGSYGIEVSDFFASDGFVRGHLFHGKRVLSYSEIKEKYGKENIIVLLSFASSLPSVLENIYKIADECELYAPDGSAIEATPHPSMIYWCRVPFEVKVGDIMRADSGKGLEIRVKDRLKGDC